MEGKIANEKEFVSPKTHLLWFLEGGKMSYYNIEDGHTGVYFEILACKEFTIGDAKREIVVTELLDAIQRRFLVLHVQHGSYHNLLMDYLGFRYFEMCPLHRECQYLIIARNDERKGYEEYKDAQKIDAYVNSVVHFLENGSRLWQETENALEKLSRLIQEAGGGRLPSLSELIQLLPEYRILKEKLEEYQKEKKRVF